MKNTLPLIFILFVAFIAGCEKEETINTDPFTNGTEFDLVAQYTIILDSNNAIVGYSFSNDILNQMQITTLNYFGDSVVVRKVNTYPLSNPADSSGGVSKYYLNSYGYADSVVTILSQVNNQPPTDTLKTMLQYNQDGFLISTSNNPSITYTYVGNNYKGTNDEYYDYVSKVDLFSYRRAFDNELTGKNDFNLPKKIIDTGNNTETTFYYQIDSLGYVTSCIRFIKFSDGHKSVAKHNYTYQFIQ